jgi:hypothetical protein
MNLRFMFVVFSVSPQYSSIILQASAGNYESIADTDIDVFMIGLYLQMLLYFSGSALNHFAMQRRLMIHDNSGTGKTDLDAYMIGHSAVLMMSVRCLHEHATACDATKVAFKVSRFRPNP